MRRFAFLLACLVLAACGRPGAAEEIAVSVQAVALYPDDPQRMDAGALIYRGGLVLSSPDPRFGGFSAIEVTADGSRLLAISDNGWWLTARLIHDSDGRLTGFSGARIAAMLGADGQPLTGDDADAEGLAHLGGGRYAVSFERNHRIEAYEIGEDWSGIATAIPIPLPAPPGADRLQHNGGIEGLAPAAGAGLWAGIEYPLIDGRPHTLWLLHPDGPGDDRAFSLALERGFGLTSLARRDEDRLIIVERFYARDTGNRIRVSQFHDSEPAPNAPIEPELLAEITPEMSVDNFEAAATAAVNGRPRLFLMSDDNYNPEQRTLLLSFGFAEAR